PPAAASRPQPPATAPAPATTPPSAAQPAPDAEPQPAPKVSQGDLVAADAPGLVLPTLVSIDKPEYPPIARRLRTQGTVVVGVLVNENGSVVETRLVRGVPSSAGLNEAALAAARTATYRPATKDGVRVKTWTNITIPFKL
ncbi:MAG TPA: TonB family protein, partial [Thermoanaerobaculia bacterium]|nr:TonB family protein [Thermoanaerobaculia bacterium]